MHIWMMSSQKCCVWTFCFILLSSWNLCSSVEEDFAVKFNPYVPNAKAWWAKQITDDIYTAGRLTVAQIKYAHEVGFNSIISMYNFTQTDHVGGEILPTTDEAMSIAEIAGIEFIGVVSPSKDLWRQRETVRTLTGFLTAAAKPVLVYSETSYSSTFCVMCYLANDTNSGWNSQPLYNKAAAMGFFFNKTSEKTQVAELSGEEVVNHPPKPDISALDWNRVYWQMKPLHKNWYLGGQPRLSYLGNINESLYVVVNVRKGTTTNGRPSQEEVMLLNIFDDTGTYDHGGRQSVARLLATRIEVNKPNSYINETSSVNYQSRNVLEFGDDVGYNENTEQTQLLATGLKYIHTPIGGEYTYDLAMVAAHRSAWMTAGRSPAVLVHCRSSHTASIAGLLAVGLQYSKNSTWALATAAKLGYRYQENGDDNFIQLLKKALG